MKQKHVQLTSDGEFAQNTNTSDLTVRGESCDQLNLPEAKFCMHCGEPIEQEELVEMPISPPQNLWSNAYQLGLATTIVVVFLILGTYTVTQGNSALFVIAGAFLLLLLIAAVPKQENLTNDNPVARTIDDVFSKNTNPDELPIRCEKCDEMNTPDAITCVNCGEPLQQTNTSESNIRVQGLILAVMLIVSVFVVTGTPTFNNNGNGSVLILGGIFMASLIAVGALMHTRQSTRNGGN